LVFHKYVYSDPKFGEYGPDLSRVRTLEKQKPEAIEQGVVSEMVKDLPVSASQQNIIFKAEKIDLVKKQSNEKNKPAPVPEETAGVDSKIHGDKNTGDKEVAQANLLPQILSDETTSAKIENRNPEKKRESVGLAKHLSGPIFNKRKQQNGLASRKNAGYTSETKDSKSGEVNEIAANTFQSESNKIEFKEKPEKVDAKIKMPSEISNKAQGSKASTIGLEPIAYLPIKLAVLKTSDIANSGPITLNLIQVEITSPPKDTATEKTKESVIRKWHFGVSATALGAIQQVTVERNLGELNATSLANLSNIKNSPVFEGSIFVSHSLTSRLAVSANAGLNTWLETVDFQTLSGSKAQFTLEPVASPNAETSLMGNPINDQRFTQTLTNRFITFWFQPKLAFKLIENWPVWLEPGYQIMLYNVQTGSWASGINGPTVALSFRKRHLELGFKCLFFRQRDQIMFVPQSRVNSLWLGTTIAWKF